MIFSVRGRCPKPLDEGDIKKLTVTPAGIEPAYPVRETGSLPLEDGAISCGHRESNPAVTGV